MKETYLIYCLLVCSILLVIVGASNYYHHKYSIDASSAMNKFKLSEDHILIRLKLFKYDNNFNYFLLVPYLIAWNLFFVILILYIIYWFGVTSMTAFFTNKWCILALLIVLLLYMGYGGIIQQVILHSNRLEKPTFIMDKEDTVKQEKE